MPLYKRCSSCRSQLPMGQKCPCVDKKRYKEADKYLIDDKYKRFYKSGEWQRAREKVIDLCGKVDIYSFYVLGKLEYGQTVHHITELKEDYRRRLDIDNLIYLTESNHKLIHLEMEKSHSDKLRIQCLLYDLLERYKRDNLT